ncbi:MAG TPA: glycosyltransferase family 1 protein, partial [Segetibacter sp.]
HNPVFFPKNSLFFYKKFTRRFLKKAKVVITLSEFIKKETIISYKIVAQKITAIRGAPDSYFKPLAWEVREKVKEQYAQGCEYFVFTGGLDPSKNLINLLKAFSIFKKWQKTNMKLIITINSQEYKDREKFNSYKYKNEIQLAENLSGHELAQVTGGAYAMIFPSSYEGFGMAVLEALHCEVPVITSSDSSMEEITGNAALYANPGSPVELAEQMKRIFKDEQLRNKLIIAGRERIKAYSWDKTMDLTSQVIQQAVSN